VSQQKTETVKVLEKALVLLEALKAADNPMGVNELAKQTSVKVATAFRLLKTLKAYGWVFQNGENKYVIGPKLSFVTEKNNFYMALKETAYYVMRKLSDREKQAMNLVVRDREQCFILQQTRTDKMIDYVPPIGSELPIYASASGKILLSELPEGLLNEILDVTEFRRFTENTLRDRNALVRQLAEIREQGYALDANESVENGFCIAVPVRAPGDEIIAGLSFSGFVGRFDRSLIPHYHGILDDGAQEISTVLFSRSDQTENQIANALGEKA
jgi:DNA-binding IclR family transcriptional regulator